jgi:hypothetical protein
VTEAESTALPPEASGNEIPEDNETFFFGPSWLMLPHELMRSLFFITGALAFVAITVLRNGAFALWFQRQLPDSLAPRFGDFYYGALQNEHLAWGCGLLVFLGLGRAVITFSTCKYRMGNGRLVIAYGLFNKQSPGGRLRLYTDSIPLPMIYDCDTLQSLTERPWNVGTVILDTVDKKSYMIRHVGELRDVTHIILKRAKVSNVRIMGTV